MKVWILLLCLLITPSAWAKTIKFAAEASYPPFVSLNSSAQVEGFETDVIKAVCQQMQADCTFSHQPWESLIISVQTGKFDAVYGGIEVTPERMQRVAFSGAIYDNVPGVITLTGEVDSFTPDFLRGKNIGVQLGTTFEQYVLDLNKQDSHINKPKSYASIQLALLDFSRGQLDVVISDYPILLQWDKGHDTNKSYQVLELPASERSHFGEGYAIAVNKKNTELLAQINAAINEIKADGAYNKIYQRYFGEDS